MSELRIETLTMPAADLGPENPLPPLHVARDLHATPEAKPGIPEDMLYNMTHGRVHSTLPYTVLDGYGRQRSPRAFRVAVLENEVLRATFVLELGGRLRSLFHKPSGTELLEANPVFQPANLAIRNAWFSGGVEWNIGVRGHSPFTCSPVFAARLTRPDGTPVLRLYEWERIRQVPYQVDAYLPDGSPVLFVRVRISNPHTSDRPMYWWSNIAVPEGEDVRVLAPADAAFKFGYGEGGLGRVPIPEIEGVDVTYSTRIGRSADFFFELLPGQRPWITALDGQGRGLVQCSTDRLPGRKLFLWGVGPGGKRWQRFLSVPGHAYIEIQAGLARTQMEYLTMPPRSEWSWLEAYGLMEADPAAVHGPDWDAARSAVEESLERFLPRREIEQEHRRSSAWAGAPPEEIVQRGTGWGALERVRRGTAGEAPFGSAALPFDDDSLGPQQASWLALLRDGEMPEVDPQAPPTNYQVQDQWRERLERAARTGRAMPWNAWLHLGVMRHHAGQRAAARTAWERSLARAPNPWATRNLAVLAQDEGRGDDAARLYAEALRMRPSLLQLAVECGRALLALGRHDLWIELLPALPEPVRSAGRVRLLEAQAALEAGDYDRVAALFSGPLEIDDLREGERSLSHLWFDYHERRLSAEEGVPIDDVLRARVRRDHPVPPEIDFRMSSDPPVE